MKQSPLYVREYYDNGLHLNPVIHKLKHTALKKPHSPQSQYQLTLAHHIKDSKRHSLSKTDEFNPVTHHSPNHSREIYRLQQAKEVDSPLHDFNHIAQSESSFLMEKNRQLESELRSKDGKIAELGKKCEYLEMQLLAVQNKSFDSNLSWTGDSHFQKSIGTNGVLERSCQVQQLKSIRERLKRIDFSKFLKYQSPNDAK